MPVLLLIRHGLTDVTGKRLTGWQPGFHLSERGRRQAEELAGRLAPVPLAALYSSTLERCLETAGPLAAAKRLEVRTADDLRDVDYGDWSGRPLAQLARTKLWRTLHQAPTSARFPGGETLLETQERVIREVARITRAHRRGAVAIVTHADPIKLLLVHFAGAHTDMFLRLVVEPASVSAVALSDGAAPRILRVNDTGSLAELSPPPRRQRKLRG